MSVPVRDRGETVSVLAGDRLCLGCAYNLLGQPIVREGHYGMLIVRCPECGTVASLQEHPLLGRWAGRWAAVLAAAWFLAMFGFLAITSAVVYTSSVGVAHAACEPLSMIIAKRQQAWYVDTNNPNAQYMGVSTGNGYYTYLDPTFWATQDEDALLAEVGGWTAVADFTALRRVVHACPALLPLGAAWAVCLIHLRRRWLVAPLLLIVAFAAIAAIIEHDVMMAMIPWGGNFVGQVAMRHLGWPFILMGIALCSVPLGIGMAFGRPLVRLLARMLVPPRLRGSLSILWTGEGLRPPKTTPGRASSGSPARPPDPPGAP